MWVRGYPGGVFWICVLFAVVWTGDAVAMYTGKLFGRHKLAPRISPKKTWEGSIGSIVGSVIAALIVYHFAGPLMHASTPVGPYHVQVHLEVLSADEARREMLRSYATFIALAILLNIAAQLGDLTESILKRGADVKDSGSLLPGHGGILDRIDALLFAAPVLWYYAAWRVMS